MGRPPVVSVWRALICERKASNSAWSSRLMAPFAGAGSGAAVGGTVSSRDFCRSCSSSAKSAGEIGAGVGFSAAPRARHRPRRSGVAQRIHES